MTRANTRDADVAIVGAGLAGATAALLFARQGLSVAIVDPHSTYPADFRCEKLSGDQVRLIGRLGLDDTVLAQSTPVNEVLVARGGRAVDLRPAQERGLRYDTLVNAVRSAWTPAIRFHEARVDAIEVDAERPSIRLNTGETIDARLIVLATGPGDRLRAGLGLERRTVRNNHSICIGFDLVTASGHRLSDRALTYYGERAGDGMAFATFFPIDDATRCNLFCHLDPKQLCIRTFRKHPLQTLLEVMPGLRTLLGDVVVRGEAEIRIAHLYEIDAPQRDGVVLIGDALHATCPVTGTGVTRVLTDVERLCLAHVPEWFASGTIGAPAIAKFYADPQKQKVDRHAAAKAERDRMMSLSAGWTWRARRAVALAKSRLHAALARRGPAALILRPDGAAQRSGLAGHRTPAAELSVGLDRKSTAEARVF